MRSSLVITALIGVLSFGLADRALAQAPPPSPASTLSDPATMERDRQRSQALLPAERERAQRVFDQAFALWQAGDFDSAKLGFERGLGIDPANGNANYYLGDILTRRGLGGHLKTGQSWTGQNRPVGEPPPA